MKRIILSLLFITQAFTAQADSTAWPDQTIIPFELAGRIIVVQAEVNGVAGNFLLDSGAPVIMLNRSYFNDGEITTHPMRHAMPTGAS